MKNNTLMSLINIRRVHTVSEGRKNTKSHLNITAGSTQPAAQLQNGQTPLATVAFEVSLIDVIVDVGGNIRQRSWKWLIVWCCRPPCEHSVPINTLIC